MSVMCQCVGEDVIHNKVTVNDQESVDANWVSMVISAINAFHYQVVNMVIAMFHLNVFVIQDGMVSFVQNVRSFFF